MLPDFITHANDSQKYRCQNNLDGANGKNSFAFNEDQSYNLMRCRQLGYFEYFIDCSMLVRHLSLPPFFPPSEHLIFFPMHINPKRKFLAEKTHFLVLICCAVLPCLAQTEAPRKPSDGPYTPKLIMPGGLLLPLYAPDSPMLKKERIHEAEIYNSAGGGNSGKGPIINVINIHNPSIEVHLVPKGQANTGTVVIVVPGGGHKILWVGPEGADYVPFFAKAGVSTIILRNRLRVDGYEPTIDAVNDAFQAIRLVRSHAAEWAIDPAKIGIIGFSAGAELSAPAALFFDQYEKNHQQASDPLASISARPDFVGVIYPGPTPFTKAPDTAIPATVPPSFIACAGSGDQVHAVWATEYFTPMLKASVPNLEMHIYGRGGHGVSGKDRETIPYGAWRERFLDWLRDLEFLGARGVETKAARDVAKYAALPPSNLRKNKN